MSAPYWWRSFAERAEDPEYLAAAAREFSEFETASGEGFDRRRFIGLMASATALAALTGRGLPATAAEITPRVDQVPGKIAGEPSYAATALVREGYATGVVLQHRMGRPVKVEGNPDHPASLGASDAMMQASILDLYDPDRSTAVMSGNQIRGWRALLAVLAERREAWSRMKGRGLRLLTGRVTSPSLAAEIAALLQQLPDARWHQWEALTRAGAATGAVQAFGRKVDALPLFDRADVVLAIESDALSGAPGHLSFARAFASRRAAAERGQGSMSRVYAMEATPTLLGAVADHRFVLKPNEIEICLRAIAGGIGAGPAAWRTGMHPPWIDAVIRDLAAHPGASLIHAGPEQSTSVHALVHGMNTALAAPGRTVRYIEPVAVDPGAGGGIGDLVADIHAGEVDTLIILNANPVYDAPADLAFAAALTRVPLSIHLGSHRDETAVRASFHAPALHPFESWDDARAFDGTASIIQPQIVPLVDGRTSAEMMALLNGRTDRTAQVITGAYWRSRASGNFDGAWTGWLRKGVVEGTAATDAAVQVRPDFMASLPALPKPSDGITLLLRPDPFLRGGALANSNELQELPRPLTRLTWGNAALVAPATARRLGLHDEDVVEIAASAATVHAPIMILPGQAEDCLTLSLGYGRAAGGRAAVGVGTSAYVLRHSTTPWQVAVTLRKTGTTQGLATTQHHQTMDGRDIVRTQPLQGFQEKGPPGGKERPSLYKPYRYAGEAWGMAISLTACIGCGACVAACQVENNIVTVGRDEVMRGREMHWLRIDRYWGGEAGNPEILFQPVPCMQCEDAPCEVVCPVGATVHDSDGLNLMVYNRCVGTRFCSNNCPYKVRRFNFYDYADRDGRPAIAWNPDVTVRARGVMEKCTYCLQRIREAKIAADRDNRPIADGEVKTACQQACPTRAIVFGNLNDPQSEVHFRKNSPLDYELLGELNTRPRTTYAARLVNRNPEIAES